MNLENIKYLEDKIWGILEIYNSDSPSQFLSKDNISTFCEDWWEISQDEFTLQNMDKLFKDESYKKILRGSCILEVCAISIAYVTSIHNADPPEVIMTLLKNIIIGVYQNYLIVIEIILSRLPLQSKENVWALKLNQLLNTRNKRRLKKKKEYFKFMAKYNDLIIEGIEKLGKGRFEISKNNLDTHRSKEDYELLDFYCAYSKSTLSLILDIMTEHSTYTITDVREYLLKALDGLNNALEMQRNNEGHYLANIGGTGMSTYSIDDTLPTVEPPFLPPIDQEDSRYTLVLDLDETLVHYYETEDDGKGLIRPYVEEFLQLISENFEIVIFTAALQDYADWVIDQIDPNNYIKHRLYRQHALKCGSIYIKDLSRIGRDLRYTIIVDNVSENFQLQPDNGIFITSWFDDVNDTALQELCPILVEIARKQVPDVRAALRMLRKQMIEQIQRGIAKPVLTLE